MTWLARINRPWVHFLLLGWLLFELQGWLYPAPRPLVGPLPPERLEALEKQWFSAVRRAPTAQQREQMIRTELDRDMLFQRAVELELYRYDTVVYQRLLRNMHFLQLAEGKSDDELYNQALEMRLHLGDEVVKRRLIQVMEQILLAQNPPAEVSEASVVAAFEAQREALRRPTRYSLQHLYFPRDRDAEVEPVLAQIQAEGLSPEAARRFSAPFLPGYRFKLQSPQQLARHFGAAFVENLEALPPVAQQWQGPVESTYGQHLVWVEEIEPTREATLDEVRRDLERDLETQARQEALADAVAELREEYEVVL